MGINLPFVWRAEAVSPFPSNMEIPPAKDSMENALRKAKSVSASEFGGRSPAGTDIMS